MSQLASVCSLKGSRVPSIRISTSINLFTFVIIAPIDFHVEIGGGRIYRGGWMNLNWVSGGDPVQRRIERAKCMETIDLVSAFNWNLEIYRLQSQWLIIYNDTEACAIHNEKFPLLTGGYGRIVKYFASSIASLTQIPAGCQVWVINWYGSQNFTLYGGTAQRGLKLHFGYADGLTEKSDILFHTRLFGWAHLSSRYCSLVPGPQNV